MKRRLERRLENFGVNTKDKIKKKIKKTKTIDTGALLRSVDFKITKKGIEFSMLDYGKFTDEGTRYIQPPREFFNKVIEEEIDEELGDVFFEYFEAEIDKKLRKS